RRLSLALRVRPLVPVELEPAQRVEDLLDVLGCRALAVGVLDPQHELALLPPREEPVVQRRARAADVQLACWGGGEADSHAPPMLRMERMNSSFASVQASRSCSNRVASSRFSAAYSAAVSGRA